MCEESEAEQVTERLSDKNPCKLCNDRCQYEECEKYAEWKYEVIKKLAEYETAEEERRLFIFPCKPGDYVWKNDDEEPCAFKVMEITIDTDSACIMVADDDQCHSASLYGLYDFGEVIFLTKEEAKKEQEKPDSVYNIICDGCFGASFGDCQKCQEDKK